jgi:hypothetical protein
VSIVEPEVIFKFGLCDEAIVGVLRPGADCEGAITPERFPQNQCSWSTSPG